MALPTVMAISMIVNTDRSRKHSLLLLLLLQVTLMYDDMVATATPVLWWPMHLLEKKYRHQHFEATS